MSDNKPVTYHKCDKCDRILLTCHEIDMRRCETCLLPASLTLEERESLKKWEKLLCYSIGFLMGAAAVTLYAFLKMLVV